MMKITTFESDENVSLCFTQVLTVVHSYHRTWCSTVWTQNANIFDTIVLVLYQTFFKTVLSSGYILILLSIEYILASLIETCQGLSRMRNVK